MGWREIVAANIIKLSFVTTCILYVVYKWSKHEYRGVLLLCTALVSLVCAWLLVVQQDMVPTLLQPYTEPTLLKKDLVLPAAYLALIVLSWFAYAVAKRWAKHALGDKEHAIKAEKAKWFDHLSQRLWPNIGPRDAGPSEGGQKGAGPNGRKS